MSNLAVPATPPVPISPNEPKITSLPSSTAGIKTFVIRGEDHTLGNVLRYAAGQDPTVSIAAYTVPHPLEAKMHMRLETHDAQNDPAEAGLKRSADTLSMLCDAFSEKFEAAWTAHGARANAMEEVETAETAKSSTKKRG